MRKQLDNRWKQIDKFEGSLKTYAETKAAWKKKLSQREGELEALRVRRLCLRAFLGLNPRHKGYQHRVVRTISKPEATHRHRVLRGQIIKRPRKQCRTTTAQRTK